MAYEDYENVKSRKKRFYAAHPDGRINVEIVNSDLEEKAVFRATVYLNVEDQKANLPRAVGFALELRDKERPLNKWGKEYDSVNFTSWTENCEESAVGRALDNAGFMSELKCSKEEMEKAARNAKIAAAAAEKRKAEENAKREGATSPPEQRTDQSTPPPQGAASPPQDAPSAQGTPAIISPSQVERLYALATNFNWTRDDVHNQILSKLKIQSAKDMPVVHYDRACDYIQKNPGRGPR